MQQSTNVETSHVQHYANNRARDSILVCKVNSMALMINNYPLRTEIVKDI